MNRDIYSEVTERIIAQLEKGVVPWQSPYLSRVGFPKNFSSGRPYSGINVLLLASMGFTSPWFLTFLQAQELGGRVKKGAKGSLVIKYGTYEREEENSSEEPLKRRAYLKAYTVFHSTQIEGIAFPEPDTLPELPETEACDRARAIVAGMPSPPQLETGTARACYRPSSDTVQMPERKYFQTEEIYYSVLFHELAHSTGHQSRLARKTLLENEGIDAAEEGRKIYAEEELVAEIAASFLATQAGIAPLELENSAAYLQGWIDALKSKDAKGWIIRAAAQAQKAADYILNIHPPSA